MSRNIQFFISFQIYEKKLKQFKDKLQDTDSGPAEGMHKRVRRLEGAEPIKTELDALNRQYIDQVLWANSRLKQIKDVLAEANIDIQVQCLYLFAWEDCCVVYWC